MSDDDGGTWLPGFEETKSESSGFTQFLTGTTELDGVSFTGALGANWVRLGRAIIGSIIASVALGVNGLVQAPFIVLTEYADGLSGAIGEVLSASVEAPIATVSGAYSFGVDQYGIAAFPIAIGIVLVSFWAFSLAFDNLRGYLP